MLRLISEITIGSVRTTFVNEVEIESSWDTFTDTAIVKFPFNIKRDGEQITVGEEGIFSRGDVVTIRLGYFDDMKTVFEGYVSAVFPDSPVVIECQDASWLLKQNDITASFESVSLEDLLDEIISAVPVNAVDAELGQFRITRVNALQVLQELKKTYGIVSYIRDAVLRVGLAYNPDDRTSHELEFQKNIISSDLVFNNQDDVKIKMKVISMLPDNTKLEVEVGDTEGETRTFHVYNITDTAELTKIGERELDKYQFDGYRGSFVTFGAPQIKHGDGITLIDLKFPEREGTYLVDKVVTKFGQSGFRQNVTLGPIISAN